MRQTIMYQATCGKYAAPETLRATMTMGWAGWMLLGMGVIAEAFVSGPAVLRTSCPSQQQQQHLAKRTAVKRGAATWRPTGRNSVDGPSPVVALCTTQGMGDGAATQQQQLLLQQEAEAAPKRAGGVDIDAIRGQRLWVQFAAFRFFERTCQLELRENGDCQFSKGMVAEVGNWRIEEEGGEEFLQFSSPVSPLYSEVFEIPSALLFWRVRIRQAADGTIMFDNGQIISERSELFGLRKVFIDEGTFKARVLDRDEPFPMPSEIDVSDVDIPDGLVKRKRTKKEKAKVAGSNVSDQIPEPPIPNEVPEVPK